MDLNPTRPTRPEQIESVMRRQGVLFTIVGTAALAGAAMAPAPSAPAPAYVRASSTAARLAYLARAVIWRDPGPLTAEQIRTGPQGELPPAFVDPNPEGVDCRWEHPGTGLGGRTAKFICRTPNGQSIRVKYFDGNPSSGNREVFAAVIAERLVWALGFSTDPVYAIRIKCLECPANPMTGAGPRTTRQFLATYEPHYAGTIIVSRTDPEQGWTFGEVDTAIDRLPPGAERARQRMHFDALALLGAFIQHGDRKHSQQRLVCAGPIDLRAGDLHDVGHGDASGSPLLVLFERPGAIACPGESEIQLQDIGATFGSAGQFTPNVGAKVNLGQWASRRVFVATASTGGDAGACHAALEVSGTAGEDARPNPRVGEAGRQLLLAQLKRLTRAHVLALFEAAHLELLGGPVPEWRDRSGVLHTGVDAWTAAFLDKVDQIAAKTCSP